VMDQGEWPFCKECTDKRVTEAVATPLVIPLLWDDVPELPKYESIDDVPTVPTGTPPPLSALAPPKPWPESVSEAARKPKRVPTMEEREAWFHHSHTTVANQVGRGPSRPSLLTRLWLLLCRGAARMEVALLRFL